jgi:shikimate kinase
MTNSAPLIVLVGFMGAGKTVVGRALAHQMEADFIDLDELITEFSGRTINSIIEDDGEAIFRLIETDVLGMTLDATRNQTLVLATGGGTWLAERNRLNLREHNAFTVWLNADFELCWQRINSANDTRPLARDEESARSLYEARRAIYQLADCTIEITATLNANEIATLIIEAHNRL